MARLGCLLVVLSLQLAQSLLQPAIARSYAHSSARPLAVRSRMVFNLAGDEVNGYRELGLPEDATYDAVMDAFMELSEQYRDDPERVLVSARPCLQNSFRGILARKVWEWLPLTDTACRLSPHRVRDRVEDRLEVH